MQPEAATCISFPKSGRTWLRLMLDELQVNVRYTHYGTGNDFRSFGRHFHELILEPFDFSNNKVIFLHRNPVDVAVSFFYECHKRRTFNLKKKLILLAEGRTPPRSIDKFVLSNRFGVPKIIEFNLAIAKNLSESANAMILSYETLRNNTFAEMQRTLQFLDEMQPENEVRRVIHETEFSKMQSQERQGAYASKYGRALLPRDLEDKNTYKVRRGEIGGYIQELQEKTIQSAKALLSEREYFRRMNELCHDNQETIHDTLQH